MTRIDAGGDIKSGGWRHEVDNRGPARRATSLLTAAMIGAGAALAASATAAYVGKANGKSAKAEAPTGNPASQAAIPPSERSADPQSESHTVPTGDPERQAAPSILATGAAIAIFLGVIAWLLHVKEGVVRLAVIIQPFLACRGAGCLSRLRQMTSDDVIVGVFWLAAILLPVVLGVGLLLSRALNRAEKPQNAR